MKIVQKYPRKVGTTLGSIFEFAAVFSKKRKKTAGSPLAMTGAMLLRRTWIFENGQKELKEKCWLLLHKNKVFQFFFPRRLGFRAPSQKSAAAIFNFQKSKIVFYTLSTYPFLLLGNPTGDFLTETEPLGGRLGGPLVSFQQVSTRALRAQDRALRARVPKKIKTFFLRLFFKTFF